MWRTRLNSAGGSHYVFCRELVISCGHDGGGGVTDPSVAVEVCAWRFLAGRA